MITVTINGEQKTLRQACNLLVAINDWQLGDETFAIAINGQFVPRNCYADTLLNDGDAVELLVPMQGG